MDIEARLRAYPALSPILDPDVFATVHLDEWSGSSIEWFDFELGADTVYAWAKEQTHGVSHQMFDHWIERNNMTLTQAAENLDISRRMISYYRAARHQVPRHIWLACLAWEVLKPDKPLCEVDLPMHLPKF